jgi:hypothetical protein
MAQRKWAPKSVAADYFRTVGAHDKDIPALLAECQSPTYQEWERVANKHGLWVFSSKTGAYHFPQPLRLTTVAAIRADIGEKRHWWIEEPKDSLYLLFAHHSVLEWWDAARLIGGTSPPPPLPPPFPQVCSDIQEALAAADELLRWCDQAAEAAQHALSQIPDWWDEIKKWSRSKLWLVILGIMILLLLWFVSNVQNIKTLLEWLIAK